MLSLLRKGIIIIHGLVVVVVLAMAAEEDPATTTEPFVTAHPQVRFDASRVTWVHAVNSLSELGNSLAGSADFLEADVSMGHVVKKEIGPLIPIMAHPPKKTSDVSLEHWLDLVISRRTAKGIKLDFKSIESVLPSLVILKKHGRKLNFPLWLNADVLPGPVNAGTTPVSPQTFLQLCRSYYPNATLSLGWTTYWFPTFSPDSWHYGWDHVRSMVDLLSCSGLGNVVTFPVRAVFACRSIPQLQWLLNSFPQSTLTVWSSKHDPVDAGDLLEVRGAFGIADVYYDLPDEQLRAFDSRKGDVGPSERRPTTSSSDEWIVVSNNSPESSSCGSRTYVRNGTFSFGKGFDTAVLCRDSYAVQDGNRLQIQGYVTFHASSEDDSKTTSSGRQQLTLVLADVGTLPASRSIGDRGDADAVLDAMNTSRLHVFEQDLSSPSSCHFFRLDTTDSNAFQAWTLPCGALEDEVDEEGISRLGLVEVPDGRRLVLPPGPVVFGMISSGDGHAVVHGLTVKGQRMTTSSSSSSVPSSSVYSTEFLLTCAAALLLILF